MRLHRDAKVDLIRTIPLFAACTPAELHRVSAIADELDFAEGRPLTKESTLGQEFVVLVEGTAEVRQNDEVVNRIGPGEFVGEIALMTGQRRTATVVTTSPVHALVIEGHAFQQLLGEAPDIKAKVEQAAWEHLQHDSTPVDSAPADS
ncbi:CRP/FNR family transcriptional regulator, cyclic AMP receptor protein [Marmoricola sp. URHA0025 HA25]